MSPSPSHRALLMSVAVALIFCGCATAKGGMGGPSPNPDDEWVNPVQEFDDGADWAYNIADTETPELAMPSWINIVSPE